jgi:CRP-like cAMP-binding protein
MNKLHNLFLGKKTIEIPKGKIILYEGHEVDKIYRLIKGYVKIYTVAGANVQRIILIYRPGDVFPLATFLSSQGVARFFYESMTPVTLQYITPKQLERKMRGNLPLGEAIISYINSLDHQVVQRVNNMVSNRDPLSKVKLLLLFICERYGSRNNLTKIDLPLTPKTIASMCGIPTKQASQQLKFLKNNNAISTNGSLLINQQKLKALKIP